MSLWQDFFDSCVAARSVEPLGEVEVMPGMVVTGTAREVQHFVEKRASLDGKISQDELVEGVSGLIEHLGVDITIDVPPPPGAGGAVPR